jgi:hypothetical protein
MARTKRPRSPTTEKALEALLRRQVQLKVRLPETLRRVLEDEARSHEYSMNREIVKRLTDSFLRREEPVPKVVARALLNSLDGDVVKEMMKLVQEQRAREQVVERAIDEAVSRGELP